MSKGIIRAVDKMGRVVIPKELREQIGVKNEVDSFDMYPDGNRIILEKYTPFCVFCGKLGDSIKLGGHVVCLDCLDKLNELRKEME